jgi:hypothetical protein
MIYALLLIKLLIKSIIIEQNISLCHSVKDFGQFVLAEKSLHKEPEGMKVNVTIEVHFRSIE